ncbi:TetR/AcrR family transcriptional regulator [Pseudooceanicola sp. HF7]|uniref:TetR/AcrR family transcriptional regulator n=1 Tax=Pseudooceanicola sp. HF7 TaxID=2721560 RepID=UPI001430B1FA|nr:TetR family transcriptional regulator [Pseudooceanicola sp. HF7]NIZ08556.1 TetR/AcrR family transcriptional regulator [Pseudooceanicola sp. HF7]
MPRTGLNAGELKERAVAVASERMAVMGCDKFRVTDVAGALGVSHAALYAHFSGKAALIDAVVDDWLDHSRVPLAEIVAGEGPAQERLRLWALTRLRLKREAARKEPHLFAAFDLLSHRLREVVLHHIAHQRLEITTLLAEAYPALPDPEHAAKVVQAALVGYSHPKLVAEYLCLPDEEVEGNLLAVLDAVLKGLTAELPQG